MASVLDQVIVVLARPAFGGNVGSICRAMMNMGLSHLRIASPRGNLFEEELRKMALHAISIYEERKDFDTLADAVADCSLVAISTARTGLYRDHARSPREWTARLLEEAAQGGKVALVFGNEINGVDNEELKLATQIIQIPSSEKYTSLNLAQAVMICAYELYVAANEFEPAEEHSPEAPAELRERMFQIWEETLLDIGFMKEEKSDHMMLGLRRILSRGRLTENDVKILMGMAKQAQWAAKNSGASESDDS